MSFALQMGAMKVINNVLRCSVCGGNLKRLKVLPKEAGSLVRYKCTCGHCEDHKVDEPVPQGAHSEVLSIEGFQEIP
jgi:hypothetical protein